jgi:excisionase family DNA binding protein
MKERHVTATPAEDNGEPKLLTTAEVAKIFRVAPSTVVGWTKKGLLPYTRTPSGRLRIYRYGIEHVMRLEHRDGRR